MKYMNARMCVRERERQRERGMGSYEGQVSIMCRNVLVSENTEMGPFYFRTASVCEGHYLKIRPQQIRSVYSYDSLKIPDGVLWR